MSECAEHSSMSAGEEGGASPSCLYNPTSDLDLMEPLHHGLELGFKISLNGAGILVIWGDPIWQ